MEIDTAPRPPAPTPWGRLALVVVLLGPVTLLVLLPMGLGLQRYVMTGTSMDGDRGGGIGRGSIAFERVVPVSDLRVGDVITYPSPHETDVMVTHRIVTIDRAGIVTQGDAEAAPDPWTLRPDDSTLSRVELTVPWVGWAYLFLLHPAGWAATVAAAVALVLLTSHRARRRTTPRPGAADLPRAGTTLAPAGVTKDAGRVGGTP
jgi:signal peptidase I